MYIPTFSYWCSLFYLFCEQFYVFLPVVVSWWLKKQTGGWKVSGWNPEAAMLPMRCTEHITVPKQYMQQHAMYAAVALFELWMQYGWLESAFEAMRMKLEKANFLGGITPRCPCVATNTVAAVGTGIKKEESPDAVGDSLPVHNKTRSSDLSDYNF